MIRIHFPSDEDEVSGSENSYVHNVGNNCRNFMISYVAVNEANSILSAVHNKRRQSNAHWQFERRFWAALAIDAYWAFPQFTIPQFISRSRFIWCERIDPERFLRLLRFEAFAWFDFQSNYQRRHTTQYNAITQYKCTMNVRELFERGTENGNVSYCKRLIASCNRIIVGDQRFDLQWSQEIP